MVEIGSSICLASGVCLSRLFVELGELLMKEISMCVSFMFVGLSGLVVGAWPMVGV